MPPPPPRQPGSIGLDPSGRGGPGGGGAPAAGRAPRGAALAARPGLRAGHQPAHRDRGRAAPAPAQLPHPVSLVPARGADRAGPLRRTSVAALHLPGAPRGDGPGRRRGLRRRRPRPAADRRRRADGRPRGLPDRRAPVPRHRAGPGAAGPAPRRGRGVRRPARGAGDHRGVRVAGADRGHRPGLGHGRHRADRRTGRGRPRRLAQRRLRQVRRPPRRLPGGQGGRPWLRRPGRSSPPTCGAHPTSRPRP